MRIILDSSALIELERQNPVALAAMRKIEKEEILVPAVAATEYYVGAMSISDKTKRKRSHALISSFTILPFTWFSAYEAAGVQTARSKRGIRRGLADDAIAGTVIDWNADLLITENKKDFQEIPQLKGKVKSFSDLV